MSIETAVLPPTWTDTPETMTQAETMMLVVVGKRGPSPRIVDTVVVDYAAVGSVPARWAS